MCDEIKNCCRICLDVESDHVPILGNPSIYLHLKSCLAMTISQNDNLPKMICVSCVNQLSEFYNFQLNARCSQDWLESSLHEKSKKSTETKAPIQPLPDSEYNSDSLLEFLNNTANIEEYLHNLGKEDIPSIVNMFGRNHDNVEVSKLTNNVKCIKNTSPKKKDTISKPKNCKINMEIDVLDSEIDVVKEILMKETKPQSKTELNIQTCYGCKTKFDNIQKLSQHISICDNALRTCMHCNLLFDSKQKMQQHSLKHNTLLPLTCNCSKQFQSKEKLMQHQKNCHVDYAATLGCVHRCKECGVTFKDRFQLYKHAREHVLKSEKRICDICGHTFIGNEALSKHRKDEHEKPDDVMYRCKICNTVSADRKEMFLHVQKHTAKPETNRHLCESCGRSFATRVTLMRHTLQHGNFKGPKCSFCNKRFVNEKVRDNHKCHHDAMVMCEKCGQTISSSKIDLHVCL